MESQSGGGRMVHLRLSESPPRRRKRRRRAARQAPPANNAHCRARSNNSCVPLTTSAKSRCNTLSESLQKWGVPLNVRFFPQALRCASSGNEAPARDFRLTESGGILSDHLKAAFRKGLRLFCNAKQALAPVSSGAPHARRVRGKCVFLKPCRQNAAKTHITPSSLIR